MQFTLDPNLTKDTLVDRHHNQRSSHLDRRHLLKLGVVSVLATALTGQPLQAESAPESPPSRVIAAIARHRRHRKNRTSPLMTQITLICTDPKKFNKTI
jgi:hypothetical protein